MVGKRTERQNQSNLDNNVAEITDLVCRNGVKTNPRAATSNFFRVFRCLLLFFSGKTQLHGPLSFPSSLSLSVSVFPSLFP